MVRGDLTEAYQPYNTWPTWEPLEHRPDRIYYRNHFTSSSAARPAPMASMPTTPLALAALGPLPPSAKLFPSQTGSTGFTTGGVGDKDAIASDHLALLTTFRACGEGYTYGYSTTEVRRLRNLSTGPLLGWAGCRAVTAHHTYSHA